MYSLEQLGFSGFFAAQAAEMFEQDFANCRIAEADDLKNRSLLFKIGVRVARLMSPIL